MAETWYRVRSGTRAEIEAVEIERSTKDFLWIKGRRHGRSTSWESYFPSWESAHEYLLGRAEREVFAARRMLELMNSFLGNVKGMKHSSASEKP